MPLWTGVVTRKAEPAAGVTVNLHSLSTGALLASTVSAAGGTYVLNTGAVPVTDTFILAVALETAGETESFNDEVIKGS